MASAPLPLPEQHDLLSTDSHPDSPPEGGRWSSWDGATHGPRPRPDWVIADLGAVEADLGVLKTGKEADVHLVRRWIPGTNREATMAAKRYRSGEHRLFHRDAGYLEGRRVRRSREMRAMARRTEYGREVIGTRWAAAEFEALCRFWEVGLPVPYPVQLDGREVVMAFVGDPATGVAAPRLVSTRPERELLAELFGQLRTALITLAGHGWTHGDLSPYNILLDHERLVVIDWPQVVDVIGNPRGFEFLERDATTMATWFRRRGLEVDDGEFVADLVAAATGRF
jgi:RIO kinase 1